MLIDLLGTNDTDWRFWSGLPLNSCDWRPDFDEQTNFVSELDISLVYFLIIFGICAAVARLRHIRIFIYRQDVEILGDIGRFVGLIGVLVIFYWLAEYSSIHEQAWLCDFELIPEDWAWPDERWRHFWNKYLTDPANEFWRCYFIVHEDVNAKLIHWDVVVSRWFWEPWRDDNCW